MPARYAPGRLADHAPGLVRRGSIQPAGQASFPPQTSGLAGEYEEDGLTNILGRAMFSRHPQGTTRPYTTTAFEFSSPYLLGPGCSCVARALSCTTCASWRQARNPEAGPSGQLRRTQPLSQSVPFFRESVRHVAQRVCHHPCYQVAFLPTPASRRTALTDWPGLGPTPGLYIRGGARESHGTDVTLLPRRSPCRGQSPHVPILTS